jgi:hypothetical protein
MDAGVFGFLAGRDPARAGVMNRLPSDVQEGDLVVVGPLYGSNPGAIAYQYSNWYQLGESLAGMGLNVRIAKLEVPQAAGSVAMQFRWVGYTALLAGKTYQGGQAPGLSNNPQYHGQWLDGPTNVKKYTATTSIEFAEGWWVPTSTATTSLLFSVTDKGVGTGHLEGRHVNFTQSAATQTVAGTTAVYIYKGGAWVTLPNTKPLTKTPMSFGGDGRQAGRPAKSLYGTVSDVGDESYVFDGTTWRKVTPK